MDYKKHYDALITRAQTRTIDCYVEKHHIIPRCMGGDNDPINFVRLTPEEHYLAHQLLVKIYPGNHKLVFAAQMMCITGKGQKRNNKQFGWLRRKFAEAKSETLKGISRDIATREKISATLMGHTVSLETREKLSSSNTGNSHPQTEETRRKISASSTGCIGRRTGKKNTEEHKKNISESIKEWHKNRKNNG